MSKEPTRIPEGAIKPEAPPAPPVKKYLLVLPRVDPPHPWPDPPDGSRSPNIRCGNCDGRFLVHQVVPLQEVKDLADRLDPGSVVPVGECRTCGALCYFENKIPFREILAEAYAALNTAPRFQVPSKGTDSYAIAKRLGELLGKEQGGKEKETVGEKHSPAPWREEQGEILDADGELVAQLAEDGITWCGCDLETDRGKANAALLKTAPKLLAALKEFVDVHGAAHEENCPADDTCRCRWRETNDRVNSAIREAEGREP